MRLSLDYPIEHVVPLRRHCMREGIIPAPEAPQVECRAAEHLTVNAKRTVVTQFVEAALAIEIPRTEKLLIHTHGSPRVGASGSPKSGSDPPRSGGSRGLLASDG